MAELEMKNIVQILLSGIIIIGILLLVEGKREGTAQP